MVILPKESKIADTFFAQKDFIHTVSLLLEKMAEDRDFYKNVMSGLHNSGAFEDAFFTILFNRNKLWIGIANIDQQCEYVLKIYCHGFTSVVLEWLASNSKISAEKMAEYLFAALPQRLRQFY